MLKQNMLNKTNDLFNMFFKLVIVFNIKYASIKY